MNQVNPYRHGGEALTFDGFGNRSRSFDGVDDYVDLGNIFSGDTVFSVSSWIKKETTDASFGKGVITKFDSDSGAGGMSWLLFTGETDVRFLIRQTNNTNIICISTTDASVGEWFHLAATVDGSEIKIYINGNLENTTAFDGTITTSTTSVVIGAYNALSNANFFQDGKIADVRYYDTDLTASQILDIYNGTNITTNLVGHWLTDADNVLDAAGTNHGTNYGSKYSYDNPSPPVEFGSASRVFNGTSDYISIPDINENTTNLSVALWLKTTDQDWVKTHLAHWKNTDHNRAWFIGPSRTAETNGKKLMVFITGNGAGTSPVKRYYGTTDVSDGTWHHVAFTWDNGTLKLFVDGLEETTTKVFDHAMTTIHNSNGPITVGCTWINNAPATFGSGGRADVRIYNSTLTATEISDIYNGTNITTNLSGHWLSDNDDVEDKAGTNDGTNYGSTYSYDNPPMDLVPSRQASRIFDGASDFIYLGDVDGSAWQGSNKKFSGSLWLNPSSISSNDAIFNKAGNTSNQYEWNVVKIGSDIRFIWAGSLNPTNYSFQQTTDSPLVANEWHHVAFTYDGTKVVADRIKLYINGSIGTYSHTFAGSPSEIQNGTQPLCIGGEWLGSGNATSEYGGKIADVRLYDTDLTASQILDIYNGTTDRTNLIGQWLTNSDDVLDHAGTNDGTNFGSTYSTDSPS